MVRGFEPERALEVIQPSYGSAYRIGGRLVLTAAHLLDEVGSGCCVRSRQGFGEKEARVVWKASQADIALIELPECIEPCETVVFGLLPEARRGETLKFQMYGYPRWGRTQREQGSSAGGRQVEGTIYLSDTSPDGLLPLDASRTPEGWLDSGSDWEGNSGAAIVCDGLIIAVQRQHQNPKRPASLEASLLSTVYIDEQWRRLLEKHNINHEPEIARIQKYSLDFSSEVWHEEFVSTNSFSEPDELDEALPIISAEEFSDLLVSYSDEYLSYEIRESVFDKILSCSWNFIVNQSALEISNFFRERMHFNKDLDILINLLRRIASDLKIIDEDLVALFDLLDGKGFFLASSGFEGSTKLIKRIIVYLLYHQPDLLHTVSIKNRLLDLLSKHDFQWIEFWIDVYLRYEIGKIYIHDLDILNTLISVSDAYRKQHPQKPISELWLSITSPLEIVAKYQRDSFLTSMKDYAKKCKNFLECKWCIAAFQRVVPLMDSSEDDIGYFNLRSLLDEFDQSLRLSSPQLQSIHLSSLLKDFLYTRDIKYLATFEENFMAFLKRMPISMRVYFQLEYACCLNICCEFQYEKISELALGKFLDNKQSPLDNDLLNNHLINLERDKFSKFKDISCSKKGLQSFLLKYIKIIYRMCVRKLLENNHLAIKDFPGLTRIFNLHSDVEPALLTSLSKNIAPGVIHRPIFYARSSFALSRINRSKNLELIKIYVEQALQASDYSVIRNAKDLAWGLYSCHYYGDPKDRQRIENLTDKLAEITGITAATQSTPKLHWLYYSGIKWRSSSINQDLINALYKAKLPRKIHQLKLRYDENFSISGFTGDMLDTIIDHRDQGSELAAALKENINTADAWNIIGTTLFDNSLGKDSLQLRQAAYFYALAKCFARETKLYDQKYCFNYIRCKGLSLQLDGFPLDDFFAVDTARYLCTEKASRFGYKEDCINSYLNLLQDHWSKLALSSQHEVGKLLNIWWIQKELDKSEFKALKSLMK